MSVTKCRWCGRAFTPRATGGKAQRVCRPACRRAFDAAGRRWVAWALAAGILTIPDLRNAPGTTCALGGMREIPPETDRPVPKPPDIPAARCIRRERLSWVMEWTPPDGSK